jgi:hypothetical protein
MFLAKKLGHSFFQWLFLPHLKHFPLDLTLGPTLVDLAALPFFFLNFLTLGLVLEDEAFDN